MKAGWLTHNGKADFSQPLDFYIDRVVVKYPPELTIHVCIIAVVSLISFSWGLFLGPV